MKQDYWKETKYFQKRARILKVKRKQASWMKITERKQSVRETLQEFEEY